MGGAADEAEEGGEAVGRSFLCPGGWELRICERCLTDDLGLPADTDFASAVAAHEIVRAFRNKRRQNPAGSEPVGPEAGDDTLHKLRHTHRHRGVTFFDRGRNVVWLLAYGYHESESEEDAYKLFDRLIEEGTIRPTTDDQRTLSADRAARLVNLLPQQAQELLAAARAAPEQEVAGALGSHHVGVVVSVYETLEETFVAIRGARSFKEIGVILAAFFPEAALGEWAPSSTLPHGRKIDAANFETCWSILHGEG